MSTRPGKAACALKETPECTTIFSGYILPLEDWELPGTISSKMTEVKGNSAANTYAEADFC